MAAKKIPTPTKKAATPAKKRLFVLLARRAHVAVVLRRLPGQWTQLVTWSTRSDSFERGQWLHGRLYERRCDLSPSGDKLIYFVAKHHLQKVDPSYTNAWTAISRPPYFTALALWPNGGTTYHGGGLFADEEQVQVNALAHRFAGRERGQCAPPHPKHAPPARVHLSPLRLLSGDQLFVQRLVRDGWTQTSGPDVTREQTDWRGGLRRELGTQRLEVEIGHQRLEYTLFAKEKGRFRPREFPAVDWADFDQSGRLVFARGETLRHLPSDDEAGEGTLVASFSGETTARVLTPAHAKKW